MEEAEAVRFKVIWLFVIRQAIFDYVKWKDSRNINNRRDAEDARKWLFCSSDVSNGLDKACLMVGIDISKVRNLANTMSPKDIKKMEFQDRDRPSKQPLEIEENEDAED
jgi:hypothetical protein